MTSDHLSKLFRIHSIFLMHILIIGCGYLGERAALSWLGAGHRVTALTRSQDRAKAWSDQGIQAIIGDVLSPSSLAALPNADLCLYAVGYDRAAQADKRTVYVDGLQNVLDVIDTKIPRLIYISSTSVYGQNAGEVINEDSPCHPVSEGGRICLDAEAVVREFYPVSESSRSAVILRLAGIYGPGRLIGRKEQLLTGQPLSGNPQGWLNLIHVDDATQAVCQLSSCEFPLPLFLLSDETPLRRSEFYGAFAEYIGAPAPVFSSPPAQSLNKRCDSRRIREELNLQLKYPSALKALKELTGS